MVWEGMSRGLLMWAVGRDCDVMRLTGCAPVVAFIPERGPALSAFASVDDDRRAHWGAAYGDAAVLGC
ncbi:hypothetical protein MPRS_15980 [Mycobacterium paraseoulense]|nr:hypothetical protein MPRS_15980 [Mycobacterium paraseoulense]